MENSSWMKCKLSDICDIISSKTSINDATLENYISTENMINDFGGVQNAEKLPTTNTVNSFSKSDILFSNIRTYFKKVWFARFDGTVSQDVLNFRAKDNVFSKFLYYTLCNPEFTEYTVLTSKGAKMPRGDKDAIKNFEIQLPPLPEQKAIASILSSLDDKIDLLHQQNQTLEALAETLFRQWFIEEAKEDWEDCTIGDLAINSKISVHPKKNLDTLYHHYSIPSFDANKKPIVELGVDIQSNKYKIELNSILFSKLNPHKDKRVWLILDDLQDNSICSTEFQVVKPTDDIYLYFLYGWLTHSAYYNEIASGVGGTSGSHQRIDPKSIFTASCIKIDKQIIVDYNIQVDPLFKKQFENQQQIQTLTKLRDTLLPKLMSGEVRVKTIDGHYG